MPDFAAALDAPRGARPLEGLRVGVPAEHFAEGLDAAVGDVVREALAELERLGATLVEVPLPNQRHGIAAYYVVAPAEASSNLTCFHGVFAPNSRYRAFTPFGCA